MENLTTRYGLFLNNNRQRDNKMREVDNYNRVVRRKKKVAATMKSAVVRSGISVLIRGRWFVEDMPDRCAAALLLSGTMY